MPRHNKIFAGPVTEVTPQVQEGLATVAILPGRLVVWSGISFALAGAATRGKVFVAQDNYLALRGVDDAWPINDRMIAMEMLDEQFFNVRVPTAVNVLRGSALSPNANGELILATVGAAVFALAEEAYNNTSGVSQLVRVRAAKGYIQT